MVKIVKSTVLMVILIVAILSGCDRFGMKDHLGPNTSVWNFLRISPSDKSQNIDLNAPIVLQFASPVERSIVEESFALFSQNDISDEMDNAEQMPKHSDINMAIKTPSTMEHLKKMHSSKGKFIWNEDNTRCEFKTETELQAGTDYYIYMDSKMLDYMKSEMRRNGMITGMENMDCPCCKSNNQNESVIVVQFRTRKAYTQ